MSAGSAASLTHSRSAAPVAFAPGFVSGPENPRGGVIWITGVAGVARTGLVDLVRSLLEPAWAVELLTPEQAATWIASAPHDERRIAIVVANASARVATEERRAQAHASGLAFSEILVVSDWDALVERTDSTLFAHLAAFFAHLGHSPSPRRSVTQPDTVVQLDWHGPGQIKKRVTDALMRARLIGTQRQSVSSEQAL